MSTADSKPQAQRDISIAVAPSRFESRWQNKSISYGDFIARIKSPVQVACTMREYARMSKAAQVRYKDQGGFVGASLKEGRRRKGAVAFRSLLTLDIDYANDDVDALWVKIQAAYRVAGVLYPTCSNSPTKPRFRLIMPLDEPVTADQYEAIARRVAGDIGINLFDDTTYEPERMMFWPAIPKDAPFKTLVREADGPWLDPTKVLASYDDWQDASFWPTSDRESARVRSTIDRQQDPTEKRGVIGAFCRTYTIQEAISKFLADVYKPASHGRYTYIPGSAEAGLVVYDDLWAYSHHGTDPTGGELCNAFDLVRLHKFADLDKDAKAGTPTVKMPSYQAMQDLAREDEAVKRTLGAEIQAELDEEFAYTDAPEDGAADADDEDWFAKYIELDRKNKPVATIDNVVVILKHDKLLRGRLKYDLFSSRQTIIGPVPWRPDSKEVRDWADSDDDGLMWYLETYYKISNAAVVRRGLGKAYIDLAYHPVREYFEGLPEWDGVGRIEPLLPDYLGADDTLYTRTVTKTHLVAAIARIFKPGIKYDTMITLSGAQGLGKSTLIKILGGAWYSNSLDTMHGKDAYEALQGAWLIEIDELSAFKKAEKERIKGFLSKTEDIFRPAYGHYSVRFPRQCIFWGTTNDKFFLRDQTGDRRTWPVACGELMPIKSVFTELEADRDQIWAEAYAAYKEGWPLTLPYDVEVLAKARQAAFSEEDPELDIIAKFLDRQIPENWRDLSMGDRLSWLDGNTDFVAGASDTLVRRNRVTALEVWCECFQRRETDFRRPDAARINEVLARMPGWAWSENKQGLSEVYGKSRRRGYIRI
ncbi:virulence-associated E family protein [Peptococcus simiae]|uniref:VapE domain-containing protein n=1 Tax=Peptococcus simiae TaxID=1643805 RepID=UPI00397FA334